MGTAHTRTVRRELTNELTQLGAFAQCSRDDIEALVDVGEPFNVPADWPLAVEGGYAECFYAITSGRARVYRGRVQVGEVGPGAVVDEGPALAGDLRQATVTAASRLAGLRVSGDQAIDLLVRRPRLLDALLETHRTQHSGAQATPAAGVAAGQAAPAPQPSMQPALQWQAPPLAWRPPPTG